VPRRVSRQNANGDQCVIPAHTRWLPRHPLERQATELLQRPIQRLALVGAALFGPTFRRPIEVIRPLETDGWAEPKALWSA